MQSRGLSGQDVANALAAQNLITPVGTEKIGAYEYAVQLNDAPSKLDELGDLPIKTVDGAMVYVRDVAQVRDGNAPQTNIVHVDGNRSVLLQVFKNGSASTLAIIAGVKRRLAELKDALPPGLKVALLGDQSLFVRGAISSVAREGVIAAALTSLMILLFLGSWRSTLIIATSIPLAVLGSIIALSAIGETLNIMTLGGLALAVGILVDDATVTIENINWHLEHGKQVEPAIMDGARQIVTPAFVSLLCICIVFVPMFFLDGVARFLFVPMAEAVMFAMICSFILSRTLVPTMANYLLKPHRSHLEDGARAASRNPVVRIQQAFEAGFEHIREGYRGALELALGRRAVFIVGFLAFVAASFLLTPYLGRDFFPSVDTGQILMHARLRVGTRVEESAKQFAEIESVIRTIIPPTELATLVDNVGMPISGINLTYSNTGVIGTQDGDIQIKLAEDHRPTADYVRQLRAELPRRFPGVAFGFLPADIISQILNFGAPAPIDVQISGANLAADFDYANLLLKRIRHVPGVADARIQQSPDYADARRRRRSHARPVCRTDRARRHQQPRRQSRRQRSGVADLLARSQDRRLLFDRHADAAIPARHLERFGDGADLGRGRREPRRFSAASPRSRERSATRSFPSTTSCRSCRSTRRRKDAISARSPTTSASCFTTPRQASPRAATWRCWDRFRR